MPDSNHSYCDFILPFLFYLSCRQLSKLLQAHIHLHFCNIMACFFQFGRLFCNVYARFFCNVIGWLFVCFFALCLFLLTDFFSMLISAHCLFWPFRFFHPSWTLFWTEFFCKTLKFPRIYDQPYFHSKKTIGCSQTKLSHPNGWVTVINDLFSAKEWRKTKPVWRTILPTTWSSSFKFSLNQNISEVYLLSCWFVYCACIAVRNRELVSFFSCSRKKIL